MDLADEAIVYFNPHTIAHKKLKEITEEQVHQAFNRKDLKVFTKSLDVTNYLKSKNWDNKVLLMMSSGNFDGVDFNQLANELTTMISSISERASPSPAIRFASDQRLSPGPTTTVTYESGVKAIESVLPAPALKAKVATMTIARERTTSVRARRPRRLRTMLPDGLVAPKPCEKP